MSIKSIDGKNSLLKANGEKSTFLCFYVKQLDNYYLTNHTLILILF